MKIGDYAMYSPIIGQPPKSNQAYKITSLGEVCGSKVAWLEGFRGCVAVEALTICSRDYEPSFHGATTDAV